MYIIEWVNVLENEGNVMTRGWDVVPAWWPVMNRMGSTDTIAIMNRTGWQCALYAIPDVRWIERVRDDAIGLRWARVRVSANGGLHWRPEYGNMEIITVWVRYALAGMHRCVWIEVGGTLRMTWAGSEWTGVKVWIGQYWLGVNRCKLFLVRRKDDEY